MDSTAPSPFGRPGPDTVNIPEGGGFAALLGFPFLLESIGAIVAALGVLPGAIDHSPLLVRALLVLFGLAFIAVGAGLVVERRWTILDKEREAVTRQWGFFVPMEATEYPLADFSHVRLRCQRGDGGAADRYPVVLVSSVGPADLMVSEPTDYGEARRQAAFLAIFLHRPLEDVSTPHPVVLQPEEVERPWTARLRMPPEQVRPPAEVQSEIESWEGGVCVTIDSPAAEPSAYAGLAVALAVLVLVVPRMLLFFHWTPLPVVISASVIGFVFLALVAAPVFVTLTALRQAERGRTVVAVTADGVTMEVRDAWRCVTTRLAAEDVLDLDYATAEAAWRAVQSALSRSSDDDPFPPQCLERLSHLARSRGVLLKTRRGLFAVGAGLPDEEVRYLYGVVGGALGRRHAEVKSQK